MLWKHEHRFIIHGYSAEKRAVSHRQFRKPTKWATRRRYKNNCSLTGRVTLQDSLDPMTLKFRQMLCPCLRFRWRSQAVPNRISLELGQPWRERYLTCLWNIGSTDDVIISPLIRGAFVFVFRQPVVSYTLEAMFDNTHYISLICRAPMAGPDKG